MDERMKAIDHLFDKRHSMQKELFLLESKFNGAPSDALQERINKLSHKIEALNRLIHSPSNWNGP